MQQQVGHGTAPIDGDVLPGRVARQPHDPARDFDPVKSRADQGPRSRHRLLQPEATRNRVDNAKLQGHGHAGADRVPDRTHHLGGEAVALLR